jgi:hypothetical protein
VFVGGACVDCDFAAVYVKRTRRLEIVRDARAETAPRRVRDRAHWGRTKVRSYKDVKLSTAGRKSKRNGAEPGLSGDCQFAVASEIAGTGFVAIDFAQGFAEAFAGFMDLGF